MTSAALSLPYTPPPGAEVSDEDLGMVGVANALLACHARGADRQTMLTMCERLLSVTEHELLERERKMMASGDPDLATHVRRHGDLLHLLSRQLRDSRRSGAPLPKNFIQFVGTMVERMRTAAPDAGC
jgi:hypothetical protein